MSAGSMEYSSSYAVLAAYVSTTVRPPPKQAFVVVVAAAVVERRTDTIVAQARTAVMLHYRQYTYVRAGSRLKKRTQDTCSRAQQQLQ